MRKDDAEEKLSKLLEIHFCDANNAVEQGSMLKKFSDQYFEKFDFDKKSQIFNALADEKRLKILNLLTFREMCVCELTAALNITQPNLTYHIKKLENMGLVEHKKQGKWVYYSLTHATEKKLQQYKII